MEKLVESVRKEFLMLVENGVLKEDVVEILERIQYPWEFLSITDKLKEYFKYDISVIPSHMSAFVQAPSNFII